MGAGRRGTGLASRAVVRMVPLLAAVALVASACSSGTSGPKLEKVFVQKFGKQIGTTPNPYSAYGAQAMDVILQAVAKGGGNRAATTKSIFGLTITGGILGTFSINNSGDTNLLPITIYRQQGKDLVPVTTITVPESLTK